MARLLMQGMRLVVLVALVCITAPSNSAGGSTVSGIISPGTCSSAVPVAASAACASSTVAIAAMPIPGEHKVGDTLTVDLGEGVGLELVWVPAGSFNMGSDEFGEQEKPVHRVTFGRGFWMAKFEVTNGEYQRFVKDAGYDGSVDADDNYMRQYRDWKQYASSGDRCPVVCISWTNARAFCEWASGKSKVAVSLPTEAEWEYACRAGKTSWFGTGNKPEDLQKVGWFAGNSENTTHEVGRKAANDWGLHDMHGNVTEWCMDSVHDDYKGAPADGGNWESGTNSFRILRGGSWFDLFGCCRSSYRDMSLPGRTYHTRGFRVVVR